MIEAPIISPCSTVPGAERPLDDMEICSEQKGTRCAYSLLLEKLAKTTNDDNLFGISRDLSSNLHEALKIGVRNGQVGNVLVHNNPDPDALAAGILILLQLRVHQLSSRASSDTNLFDLALSPNYEDAVKTAGLSPINLYFTGVLQPWMPSFLGSLSIDQHNLGELKTESQRQDFNNKGYCLVDISHSENPHAHGGNSWLRSPYIVVDHHHGESNGHHQFIIREQTCSTLIALSALGQLCSEAKAADTENSEYPYGPVLERLAPLIIAGIATDTSYPLADLRFYRYEKLFDPMRKRVCALGKVWLYGNLAPDLEALRELLDWLTGEEETRCLPGYIDPDLSASTAERWGRPAPALEAILYLLPILDTPMVKLLENEVSIKGHRLYGKLSGVIKEYETRAIGDLLIATANLGDLEEPANSHLTGGMADELLEKIAADHDNYFAHLVVTQAECPSGDGNIRIIISIRVNPEFKDLGLFQMKDLVDAIKERQGGYAGGDGLRGGGQIGEFLELGSLTEILLRLTEQSASE